MPSDVAMPRPHLPYLERTVSRGTVFYYVRLTRQSKRIRIRGAYGSPQFMAEYRAAIAGKPIETPAAASKASLQWLADKWRESSDWHLTADATKRQRNNILSHILEANGTKPYALVTEQAIEEGRERRMKTPFAANNYLKTMKAMFAWAHKNRLVADDPAKAVQFLARRTVGHKPWNDADLAAYRATWPIGTRERLAMELVYWTGLRRGDAVRLGAQHLGKDGVFRITMEKTGRVANIPLTVQLYEILQAGPVGDLTYIVQQSGKPLTKEHFGNVFRGWCNKAGVKSSVHGLRKTVATESADGGASDMELQNLLGHSNTQSVAVYTRDARQAELAKSAMVKRGGNILFPSAQKSLGKKVK